MFKRSSVQYASVDDRSNARESKYSQDIDYPVRPHAGSWKFKISSMADART